MSSPHPLFYNIAPKGGGCALTLRRTFIKTWESVPEHAEHLFEAYLNTMFLFRRRSHAPLSQTCTAGACACSCKSRRAPRPRKPDGKLNRHGLGARRVALLAPRGVLSKYRYPLGYVGAITKILVKLKSKSRILGDGKPIPSGGGVPEGRRGSVTPMSGDGSLFISPSTTLTPSEHPRDEKFDRACLSKTNGLIERPRTRRTA